MILGSETLPWQHAFIDLNTCARVALSSCKLQFVLNRVLLDLTYVCFFNSQEAFLSFGL